MRRRVDLRLIVAGVGTTLLLLSLSPASASSANISHSYSSDTSIVAGSLVSLDPSRSNYVEQANSDNGQHLLGIAVNRDDSLMAVDPTVGSVQVATSGTANALVSTLNGSIDVGDQISVSPINGLGMKAAPSAPVIGLAQTNFNSNTAGAIGQSITEKSGKTNHIVVGFVRLGISIGAGSTDGTSNQLNSLQELAKEITGHAVSTARIIVSLVIALVAFVSLVTLIYASIYSGIISIGRNPLAKYAVFRSMSSVLVMVLLIAIVATATIFLLLK